MVSHRTAQLPILISTGIQLSPLLNTIKDHPEAGSSWKSAVLAAAQAEFWNLVWSPLSLNTSHQVIGKSCWISLQNMPRTCLLLTALWLLSSSQSSSSHLEISPVASYLSSCFHPKPPHPKSFLLQQPDPLKIS